MSGVIFLGDGMLVHRGAGGGGGINPPFSKVVGLYHCDGADESTAITSTDTNAHNATGTASATDLDTGLKKFGSASLECSGGQCVTASDIAAFFMGSGDFTAEAWAYWTGAFSQGWICGTHEAGNTPGWTLGIDASGNVAFFDGTQVNSGNIALVANTWTHVAMSRVSNQMRLFVGGVKSYDVGDGTNYNPGGTARLQIGDLTGTGTQPWMGHLDEIRITKGQGLYTVNFTPPSSPFPDS